MSEEQWGDYAFSRDPICGKVPLSRQREMARLAEACGRAEAQKLKEQFGTNDPLQLAEALEMKIVREDSFGTDNFITFAQFRLPNTIALFMGNVREAQRLIAERELGDLLQHVEVEQLLVAHELYHWVEESNPTLYTRSTKVELWGIGKFRYTSGLVCLGELAAMAFAAELLCLPYSPYVFDVLLPWGKDEAQARKLYNEIIRFRADNTQDTTISLETGE